MDEGNLLPARLAGFMHIGRAVDEHTARVRPVDPAEHLDQCRFSRAVFPQQGNDLAALDLERNALQGLRATEGLFDTIEEQAA